LHVFALPRGALDLAALSAALGATITVLTPVSEAEAIARLDAEWDKWEQAPAASHPGAEMDDDII
jgi:hypothetical protein